MTAPIHLHPRRLQPADRRLRGGASPSSVATLGKTTSTTVAGTDAGGTTPINPADQAKHYDQALKLSKCIARTALPTSPTPAPAGGIEISGVGPNSDLNPNNPQFSAAQNACQKYSRTRRRSSRHKLKPARWRSRPACVKTACPTSPTHSSCPVAASQKR